MSSSTIFSAQNNITFVPKNLLFSSSGGSPQWCQNPCWMRSFSFFDVWYLKMYKVMVLMTSPLLLYLECQSIYCLQSSVCGLRSAVCKCHTHAGSQMEHLGRNSNRREIFASSPLIFAFPHPTPRESWLAA